VFFVIVLFDQQKASQRGCPLGESRQAISHIKPRGEFFGSLSTIYSDRSGNRKMESQGQERPGSHDF
jgi:hypothetical protein